MTASRPDAAVVGAGIAGLVATLELLDRGCSVVLLDRCRPDELGGLAREAFGGMFMVDTPEQRRGGIRDSYELALEDWLRVADFDEGDIWPRRWAEAYVARSRDEVGGWLRERGVRFFPVVNWAERGLFGDGNSVPRFHMTWGTGKRLVEVVWRAIERHRHRSQLDVRLRHRVVRLLRKGGTVTGCAGVAEGDGSEFEVEAGAVVVASGGIGGNLDRVRREWPESLGRPPERILMGSHLYADGAMHDEVERAGGAVTNLERMWNYADAVRHPEPRRPLHGLKLIPPRSGLAVDPTGRRYGPVPHIPTFDAHEALRRVCSQELPYSWLVCNERMARRELDVSGSQHNVHLRERRPARFVASVVLGKPRLVRHLVERCEDFVAAGSVSELAAEMGRLAGDGALDGDLLEAEVRRYDERIGRGRSLMNDDQLRRVAQLRSYRGDRLRTCDFQRIADPKAMPLIAIRLQVLSRKSLGGIQTDLACRVLTPGGDPVGGLYAVGEAAGFGGGGMHGWRSLEGTFLGGCVLTGRIAAGEIAAAGGPLRAPEPRRRAAL